MMDLILGAIPLWVWIVVGLLIAAPVLYFRGPIWNGLPNWIKYPVYAVVSFFGFFILGQRKSYLAAKGPPGSVRSKRRTRQETNP